MKLAKAIKFKLIPVYTVVDKNQEIILVLDEISLYTNHLK